MKTRILTQDQVHSLLKMELAVPAVERAFAAHGRGETVMPAKVYLPLEKYDGDFRAMPAYFEGSAGIKWVNSHGQNPSRHGLPAVLGIFILNDPETAVPLAIMDATYLTAVRTGAAAAVASKHLAVARPESVGFVGCGVQARALLNALRTVFEDFEVVAADHSPAAAERFAAEVGGRSGPVEAAAGCQIVCTATPSRSPIVRREWVRPAAHLNAMGADAPGKQELDPQILQEARVVIDDFHQATESGEINVPLKSGALRRQQIHATLGEVVAGIKPGRGGEEITVFDSTGLAIQDVALARVVYQAAVERGVGLEVELIPGQDSLPSVGVG